LAKSKKSQEKTHGLTRYRVLSQQSQSVALEKATSFQVKVGPYRCNTFLKPMHDDPSLQRAQGGAVFHLEYETEEQDILRAALLGTRLTEDVLSGLAVVTGVPLGSVNPVQIMDITLPSITRFLFLITAPHLHTNEAITAVQLSQLRGMLAHWDGLPRGQRMRRAAGLYRRALQQDDDLSSFQFAYMGLEALEPVLAEQTGVRSGVEETKGKCETCGAEFIKRRTVLNGVRAYITGAQHPRTASPIRNEEWRRINNLRQKQFHSLEDPEDLYFNARDVLPAAAHFLHDAICCLSHAHALESPKFTLVRGPRLIAFVGTAMPGIQDALEQCRPIIDLNEVRWDAHAKYGFVPQIGFRHNRPGVKIGGRFCWLQGSLRFATEANLVPATLETDLQPE
jgi:hypothetical protein